MHNKNNEDLLISIVMPVYNAEEYLERAIKCVVYQTYPNWELILVDDCSTDASLSICYQWADIDDRIHVIHHEQNMGIARSRTDGISVSLGSYVGFIDSDDIIHPQMYELFVTAAKRYKSGIVMCDSKRLSDAEEALMGTIINYEAEPEMLSKECAYGRMFASSETDWQYLVLWNKIYKAEIAKMILITTRGCEDGAFNSIAIRLANGLIKLNTKPLYYWVQHSHSITHAHFNERNIEILGTYFDIAEEIAAHDPHCFHSVAVKAFKVLLHTRYNSRKTGYRGDVKQFIDKKFPDFYKRVFNCKEISFRWKCVLSIFYYFPFTYNLFRAFCG